MNETAAEWPPMDRQGGPTPPRSADAASDLDLDRLVWDQDYRQEMRELVKALG